MKKRLFKMMLLVTGLLLGVNVAWGDNVTLLPTADTDFDWSDGDTSFGSATTLPCGIWQEYWTNAVPGLKVNGGNRLAVLKFNVADYKGKITAATLKVTATNPSTNSNTRSIYLGYFTNTGWDETTTANNSGMTT